MRVLRVLWQQVTIFKNKHGLYGTVLIFLVVVCFVKLVAIDPVVDIGLYLLSPKNYYAYNYGVKSSDVYIQAKPHDCEWDKTPIGKKNFHSNKKLHIQKT